MSDPILQLNQVIYDISGSMSNAKDQMYAETQKLYENYGQDVEYMGIIHTLIESVKESSIPELKKTVHHKQKEQDIQDYYHKQYQQQIFILKILILFALLTMVGCLLFNYGTISVIFLTFYLGFVFSIGFVVVFYYLWDFFLRDTTEFDEYNFLTYVPPKTYDEMKKDKHPSWSISDLSNNNILC